MPVHGRLPLPLRTDRLTLRLHAPGDEAWMLRVYARPDVARHLLEGPSTAADVARKLQERLARTGLGAPPGQLALVIEHDGTPVGDVALWLTDAERGVAEIGWVLDPEHGGRGFAREAVAAVLDAAFAAHDLHRVVAQMDARNTASARLAAAVGMRQEAHFRQDWWSKGEWTDSLVFARLGRDG